MLNHIINLIADNKPKQNTASDKKDVAKEQPKKDSNNTQQKDTK